MGACFDSAVRLFHNCAPLKEKTFLTVCYFFKGNLRIREEHAEFLVKRLLKYCGANPLRDLKTIVPESILMSSEISNKNRNKNRNNMLR